MGNTEEIRIDNFKLTYARRELLDKIRKSEYNTEEEITSNIVGTFDVVYEDCITVTGVRLMEGSKGSFVSMPSIRNGEKWSNITYFESKEIQEEIYQLAGGKYVEILRGILNVIKEMEIRVTPLTGRTDNLLGLATVKVGELVVRNVKILNGVHGAFVKFPEYRSGDTWKPVVFPHNELMQGELTRNVLERYNDSIGNLKVDPHIGKEVIKQVTFDEMVQKEKTSFENYSFENVTFNDLHRGIKEIKDSSFYNCSFTEFNGNGINMTSSRFRDCEIRNSSFEGANLKNTSLINTRIHKSNFHKASLENADLTTVPFLSVGLTDINVTNATFRNVTLAETIIEHEPIGIDTLSIVSPKATSEKIIQNRNRINRELKRGEKPVGQERAVAMQEERSGGEPRKQNNQAVNQVANQATSQTVSQATPRKSFSM